MTIRTTTTIACALAAAAGALADDVEMRFRGTANGQIVEGSAKGQSFQVFAGQYKHQVNAASGKGESLIGDIIAFCTEVLQGVEPGFEDTAFDVVDLTEAPDPASDPFGPGQITQAEADAIGRLYTAADGRQFSQSSADTAFVTAFALAIWEITYDLAGGLDLADGDFIISSDLTGVQGEFDALANAATDTSITPFGKLAALTNPDFQDQIVIIPLPGTAGLAALGLAGVALRRRR